MEIIDYNYGIFPWFQQILKARMKGERNNLILIVGEASSGKSYAGLTLCKNMDPHFTVDNVVFTASEFFDRVKKLKKHSWVLFDEPAIAISHREWYSQINKVLTWTIESFRFKLIHVVFTSINANLIDKALREYLIHFLIVMQDRGWGRVYRYNPSQFRNEVRTPFLGEIFFGLPPKELCEAYERKRAEVQNRLYEQYAKDIERTVRKRLRFEDYYREALANIDKLRDREGQISTAKIRAVLGVGKRTAQDIRKLLIESEA